MFPLNKRKVQGYSFGQKTFYGTKHTGTDYLASYVNYYAPFDGYASAGSGPEGGTWWQLTRPDGTKFIARHLSKLIKVGKVREGELVAVTGNSGAYTTNPHLHQEVYIKGKISDPEKFNWGSSLKKEPMFREYKGTIYGLLAGYWIAVATGYEDFVTDWGAVEAKPMTEAQFKAFPLNKRTIK
jgi:hypothetical protein